MCELKLGTLCELLCNLVLGLRDWLHTEFY